MGMVFGLEVLGLLTGIAAQGAEELGGAGLTAGLWGAAVGGFIDGAVEAEEGHAGVHLGVFAEVGGKGFEVAAEGDEAVAGGVGGGGLGAHVAGVLWFLMRSMRRA